MSCSSSYFTHTSFLFGGHLCGRDRRCERVVSGDLFQIALRAARPKYVFRSGISSSTSFWIRGPRLRYAAAASVFSDTVRSRDGSLRT